MEIDREIRQLRNDGFDDAADLIEKLTGALRDFASSNAWQNFGDCRRFGGRLLPPDKLDELASSIINP